MRLRFKGYVFLFVIVIGIFFSIYYYMSLKTDKRKKDLNYNISVLVQTGPKKEALKSVYLEEILELSIDKPSNFFNFDEKKAQLKLLSNPLIKDAFVKKIKPNTIYVDYSIQTPIAKFLDFNNIAIDETGSCFPFFPFYSPKNLPEIYLNDENIDPNKLFAKAIKTEKVDLALYLLKLLNNYDKSSFEIKRIDLSNVDSKSYGKKEIVIFLDHILKININSKIYTLIFPRILRLNPDSFEEQMGNYFNLNSKMLDDYKKQIRLDDSFPLMSVFGKKIVDLRIEKMAFID